MLYNILPPAIFVLSLSGIIIVVSRVVMRMRQAEFVAGVKSFVPGGEAPAQPGLSGTSLNDAADVLRPNYKSVQAIKSRLALAKRTAQAVTVSAGSGVSHLKLTISAWQKKRRLKQAKKQAAVGAEKPSLTGRIKQAAGRASSALSKFKQTMPAPAFEASQEDRPKLVVVSSQPKQKLGIKTRLVQAPAVEKPAAAKPAVPASPPPTPISSGMIFGSKRKEFTSDVLKAAAEALDSDKLQRAEDLLVSHIIKHTKDTDAYMLLGQTAVRRGAWGEALEIFEQVIKMNDHEPEAYASLGLAAYRAGRLTRAIEALQRAHEADPANLDVLRCLLSIAKKMDNVPLQHSIEDKLQSLAPVV